MNVPILFCVFILAAPPAFSGSSHGPPEPLPPRAAVQEYPVKLGAKTAEGFNDPAHLYFFRYQAYLRRNGLAGLDPEAWKKLSENERAAKIKTGEDWLRDKLSALMSAQYSQDDDWELLAAVWGRDVASAAGEVSQALELGDPDQIRAAREKVQGLVKNVGGASVDWPGIFDGAAPGAVTAPSLPDPLALKKQSGFLASLQSKEVRAPLASKATFVAFLEKKQVPADALPALTAMYDVLSRAKEPERSETAHLLPTVVRFLNDGKKIADEEYPDPHVSALAFAAAGDYDKPDRVGITSLCRTSDPVEVGSVLSHEFEHVYDQYAGRYYTLDSELRGFKTNVMFFNIMKKDPQLSKKLDELMNSDDNATRDFFRDHANVAASYAESPKAFADMVAFGHSYNQYNEGAFQGRLTLREATDPEIGLQRQISGQNAMVARFHARAEALQKRLAEIQANPPSLAHDKDLEKTTSDLAGIQTLEISERKEAAVSALRLSRMQREAAWMDQRATAAGQPPPAYDLSLPVDKNYVVSGD